MWALRLTLGIGIVLVLGWILGVTLLPGSFDLPPGHGPEAGTPGTWARPGAVALGGVHPDDPDTTRSTDPPRPPVAGADPHSDWIRVRSGAGLPLQDIRGPGAEDPDTLDLGELDELGSIRISPECEGRRVASTGHRSASLRSPVTELEPISLLTLTCARPVRPLEPRRAFVGIPRGRTWFLVPLIHGTVDGTWRLVYDGTLSAQVHGPDLEIEVGVELASGWRVEGELRFLDDVRAVVVLDPRAAEPADEQDLVLALPDDAPGGTWEVFVDSTRWDPVLGTFGPAPERVRYEGAWGHLTAVADPLCRARRVELTAGQEVRLTLPTGRPYTATARSQSGDWFARRIGRHDGTPWTLEPQLVRPVHLRLLDEDLGTVVPRRELIAVAEPLDSEEPEWVTPWLRDVSHTVGPDGRCSLGLARRPPPEPVPLPAGSIRLRLEVDGYEAKVVDLDLDLDRGTVVQPLEVHLRRGATDLVALVSEELPEFEWERSELLWASGGVLVKVGDVRWFCRVDAGGSSGAALELRFPDGDPAGERFRREAGEGRVHHALLWTGDRQVLGLERREGAWHVLPTAERTLEFVGFPPTPEVAHRVWLHWGGIDAPFGSVPPRLFRHEVRIFVPREGVELSVAPDSRTGPGSGPRLSPPLSGPWELHAPAD